MIEGRQNINGNSQKTSTINHLASTADDGLSPIGPVFLNPEHENAINLLPIYKKMKLVCRLARWLVIVVCCWWVCFFFGGGEGRRGGGGIRILVSTLR